MLRTAPFLKWNNSKQNDWVNTKLVPTAHLSYDWQVKMIILYASQNNKETWTSYVELFYTFKLEHIYWCQMMLNQFENLIY